MTDPAAEEDARLSRKPDDPREPASPPCRRGALTRDFYRCKTSCRVAGLARAAGPRRTLCRREGRGRLPRPAPRSVSRDDRVVPDPVHRRPAERTRHLRELLGCAENRRRSHRGPAGRYRSCARGRIAPGAAKGRDSLTKVRAARRRTEVGRHDAGASRRADRGAREVASHQESQKNSCRSRLRKKPCPSEFVQRRPTTREWHVNGPLSHTLP